MTTKLIPNDEKMINVECKCGHFERVFRGKDTAQTVKRWKNMLCRSCFKSNAIFKEDIKNDNPPFFSDITTGTEKQKAFAKKILDGYINSVAWGYLRKDLKDYVLSKTAAKWFIENRFKDLYELLRDEGKIKNINDFFELKGDQK